MVRREQEVEGLWPEREAGGKKSRKLEPILGVLPTTGER